MAGLGVAMLPGVPQIRVTPDVIGLVVLPPLLYASAEEMSWRVEHARERLGEEERDRTTADAYRQLRIDVIAVETAELRRLYDINRISDTTRRRVQRRLDLEEARLGEG
nr:hypothetical protein [Streptomyces silvisoli]